MTLIRCTVLGAPKKVLHCPQVKMEKLECAANSFATVEGSSWEADMNRPVVVYKDGLYHMWYTGQNDGKSWIGYAISKDGYNLNGKAKNRSCQRNSLGRKLRSCVLM